MELRRQQRAATMAEMRTLMRPPLVPTGITRSRRSQASSKPSRLHQKWMDHLSRGTEATDPYYIRAYTRSHATLSALHAKAALARVISRAEHNTPRRRSTGQAGPPLHTTPTLHLPHRSDRTHHTT